MFCPRCGQQQVVEEVRFCPRCGFPLNAVAALVANDGAWPAQLAQPAAQALTPQVKGLRRGGVMMLAGATLTAILGILAGATWLGGEVALIGVVVFIIGLARLLYAAIFQGGQAAPRPDEAPRQQTTAQLFQPAQPRAELPQHHPSVPASFRRADTAELVAPPASVTENTTRLLDKDQPDATNR